MADYKAVAAQAARKYGLDPHVFVRQINAESGFNPNARSPAGAIGIAQIMPATAKGWGVNPNDPQAALDAAARNMASYVHKYGSYKNALVAYNAGPGRVGKPLLPETAAYVQRILGGSDPSPSGTGGTQAVRKPSATATPSVAPDQSAQRAALISQYLSTEHQPGALTGLASGLLGLQSSAASTPAPAGPKVAKSPRVTAQQMASTSQGGLASFDGKKVAAWIAPALQYARQHGWSGTVSSGYRSDAEQTRIYKSGVRPAALPQSMGGGGSNHEFKAYPGGAVDVTNAAQLAAILRRSPYANKLEWAGAKDPVHFSHPHNGSY